MFSKNRNHLESWEDYDETPAGRAFLNMPWMWEDGACPQKKQADIPAVSNPPEPLPATFSAYKPSPASFLPVKIPAIPAPFKQAFSDPFKAGTAPLSGFDYGDTADAFDSSDPFAAITEAYKHQRAFTGQMLARMKERPLDTLASKPATVISPVTANPEVITAPFKTQAPAESQTPYAAMGQLMKPVSDAVRAEVIEPVAIKLGNTVKNKQAVNPHEQDLVNMAAPVGKAAGEAYTRDNYIKAIDAIHQGKTGGNETAYSNPASAEDVLSAVHESDSFGLSDTMASPDMNASNGFEKSRREIILSFQEVRLMGNKLIDPEGKYIDTEGLQQWVNNERQYLKNMKLTELVDFRELDWERDPDKFIELGGRYFRESLLGTHLFSYGAEAIKGGGAGEFFGAVAGVAKFYNQTDNLMETILAGGALASADIGWDRLVERLSQHLPGLSRQALLFANSVMSNEVKARVFERMVKAFRRQEAQRRTDPTTGEDFTVTIRPPRK